jgi:hypothetical protein
LNPLTTSLNATPYNRYTFYRLISQLGTDSAIPSSNKVYFADYQTHYTNRLHLNYANLVPNGQTNFIPWSTSAVTRASFFTSAADRLLRSSLDLLVLTNQAKLLQTNYMMGLTPVRQGFCATNIQLYHNPIRYGVLPFYTTNNEYTATTHRLLQLAANIYDATTVQQLGPSTNDYPSVYRPVFMRTPTNFIISGWIEETNANQFLSRTWMSIEEAALSGKLALNTNILGINVYGVPLVIGAKKGYPSFNKAVVQTVADISRKLEVRRTSQTGPPVSTNQMYVIGVSNRLAVEGWNSYRTDFNRNLELRATNQLTFALYHHLEGSKNPTNLLQLSVWTASNTTTMASWPGSPQLTAQRSFVVPIDTNIATVARGSIYSAKDGTLLTNSSLQRFEQSFRVPQWTLLLTNRLQYLLIDRTPTPPRIIDFANLDKMVSEVDLSRGLTGDTNSSASIFGDKNKPGAKASLTDGDMWIPSHVTTNVDTPTLGALNQINVAKGNPFSGQGTWNDASGQIQDKTPAITLFNEFLKGQVTNLFMQVPFTPSRRLYQKTSWEVNDPLVHYMVEDVTDLSTTGSTNMVVQAVPLTYDIGGDAKLRQINGRYRPWGGNPNLQNNNDTTAFNLTFKDPLIRRSDDWQFPTNKFPNLGWLGRVHRGTPWQTVYLKAGIDPRSRLPLDLFSWAKWSGSFGTHPTNDWRLLDLFTVAPNDTANRGLLSVNQTNAAAWAAVLSGVTVVTNTLGDGAVGPSRPPLFAQTLISPNSAQMASIVGGINRARVTNTTFQTVGEILSVPELTVLSPYLNRTDTQMKQGLDDAAYEKIPQQILSLLKTDEPRVTIYAFGQALKPADRSLVTAAGFFNLCTNYQVTGEFASKAVVRLEALPPEATSKSVNTQVAQKMRAVVESYAILQSD